MGHHVLRSGRQRGYAKRARSRRSGWASIVQEGGALRNAPRIQHGLGRLILITTCCVVVMVKAMRPSDATAPKSYSTLRKSYVTFFLCATHGIPNDHRVGRRTRPSATRNVARRRETRTAYRIHWLIYAIAVEQIGEQRAAAVQVSAHLQRGRRAYNCPAGIA